MLRRCICASASWEVLAPRRGAGDVAPDGEPLSGTNGELGRRPADPSLNPAVDADPGRGEGIAQDPRFDADRDEIAGERQRADPSGTLRVACAHFTAMQLISPLLPDFLARYPLLRLELDINNHPVSLIGERIDVAIRITDNPEAGAIARRLGVCRSLLCAAPGWMRQHGPLTTPDDLQRHNCLLYSHFASQHWQFSDAQGREASVAVNGNLSAGISSLLLEAAVAGCGIAMLPELEARGAIASGTLEVVLPEWTPKALSVYGIYLSRDYQPDGLPLFLDALQRRLGEETGHG
ncbi:LysR family transcriptional regulator [Klebsiella pneumoniae]|uniref:LysR family transcriptional regulator n=1 Tax=Klebsiella pneumoniae TaxID=573 RepID=A0A377TYD6_KLEPN|nr:LysR family transcriptional regulator [Klebsiella pneumoniae]